MACCGPPHPNRDRDKAAGRQAGSAGASGGGAGSGSGSGEDKPACPPPPPPQVDLYGTITREGSAANGGWFEVALDSQPDKKVYYRRGSICKLKQQPQQQHAHSQQQTHQHNKQQQGGEAVRAITHLSHPQQASSGVLAATIATPATLLSAPSSPPTFVLQHQPGHGQHQPHSLPSATLLLSPIVAHCTDGSTPPLLLQHCVASPPARPVCTCSLGCAPLLPGAPLSFVSSASARRASTGSVEGSLSLSFAALPSPLGGAGCFSPTSAAGGSAGCVELNSPPFAAASRSVSTPSRPLMLTGLGSSPTPSSLLGSFSSPESSHPSAFTSVVSTSVVSASSTAVLAPRALRVAGGALNRGSLASLLHPLSAPVLPLSVAVPAARRPLTVGYSSAVPTTTATAAMACAPFSARRLLSAASKRRRLSLGRRGVCRLAGWLLPRAVRLLLGRHLSARGLHAAAHSLSLGGALLAVRRAAGGRAGQWCVEWLAGLFPLFSVTVLRLCLCLLLLRARLSVL